MFESERIKSPGNSLALSTYPIDGDPYGLVSGFFRLVSTTLSVCNINIQDAKYNPESDEASTAEIWITMLRIAQTSKAPINMAVLVDSLSGAEIHSPGDYSASLKSVISSFPKALASDLFSYDLKCTACNKEESWAIMRNAAEGQTSLSEYLSSSLDRCPNCNAHYTLQVVRSPVLLLSVLPESGIENIPLRITLHNHSLAVSAWVADHMYLNRQGQRKRENYTVFVDPNNFNTDEIFVLYAPKQSSLRGTNTNRVAELTFLKPRKIIPYLRNSKEGQVFNMLGSIRIIAYVGLEYLSSSLRKKLVRQMEEIQPSPPVNIRYVDNIRPKPQEVEYSEMSVTEESSSPPPPPAIVYETYEALAPPTKRSCRAKFYDDWLLWLVIFLLLLFCIVLLILDIIIYAFLDGTLVVNNLLVKNQALVGFSSTTDPNIPRNFPGISSSAPATYNLLVNTGIANWFTTLGWAAQTQFVGNVTFDTLTAAAINTGTLGVTGAANMNNINAQTIQFSTSMTQGQAATVDTWTTRMSTSETVVASQNLRANTATITTETVGTATITTLTATNANINALTTAGATLNGQTTFSMLSPGPGGTATFPGGTTLQFTGGQVVSTGTTTVTGNWDFTGTVTIANLIANRATITTLIATNFNPGGTLTLSALTVNNLNVLDTMRSAGTTILTNPPGGIPAISGVNLNATTGRFNTMTSVVCSCAPGNVLLKPANMDRMDYLYLNFPELFEGDHK